MNAPRWVRAHDLAHALTCLREGLHTADASLAGGVRLLAGGQSLIPAMRLGLDAPGLLIDLQRVPELGELSVVDDALWIGAMCTHARVAASPLVRQHLPGLARLADGIADQQVRNRGTLGGSIVNADPAACWPAGLLALGAEIVTDRRVIAADDFFCGLFETALLPDEIVRGVRFPTDAQLVYLKFEQPASRFALVGAAVARVGARTAVPGDAVRVALTGLGHGVCRWPDAEALLARRFDRSALDDLSLPAERASDDLHASAGYRVHLARVLTQRAVDAHRGDALSHATRTTRQTNRG